MNHGIFQDGISYSDFARFLEDVWNPHLLNKILKNEIFMMRTRYVFSVTFLMNCQLFLRWLLPVIAVIVVVDLQQGLLTGYRNHSRCKQKMATTFFRWFQKFVMNASVFVLGSFHLGDVVQFVSLRHAVQSQKVRPIHLCPIKLLLNFY